MTHKELQFNCHHMYDYALASQKLRRNAWLHLLGVLQLSIDIASTSWILRLPTENSHFYRIVTPIPYTILNLLIICTGSYISYSRASPRSSSIYSTYRFRLSSGYSIPQGNPRYKQPLACIEYPAPHLTTSHRLALAQHTTSNSILYPLSSSIRNDLGNIPTYHKQKNT